MRDFANSLWAGRRWPVLARLALAGLLLAGCSAAGDMELVLDPTGQQGLAGRMWPVPPEVPRYRYVGELVGEQNFRLKPNESDGVGRSFANAMRTVWIWITGLGSARLDPVVLQRPQSGVTDADGRIYVTDTSRQAVFVFDPLAGELQVWEYADPQRRFVSPVGIAIDPDGLLLVTDAELAAVFRFLPDGTPQGSFGEGVLQRPTGIAIDPVLKLTYVADTEANEIRAFDRQGRLVETMGTAGEGEGALNRPVYLAFAGGRLYVSDALNARIQSFDREGNVMSLIGRRGLYVGNLTRPKGVALDNEGHIYVVEGFYDHLLVYAPDGRFLLGIGGSGHAPGQFYLPTGVWTDGGNRVYVADMFNGRVSIFQFLGEEQ